MEAIGQVDESTWFFQNIVKRRVALGFAAGVLFVLFACPSRGTVFLGFWIALAGELLRTWSSGVIVKNKELATEGPYRLVRNPLYVGNFLIGLGVSIMGGRVLLLVLFLVGFLPVYRALVAKEESYLLEAYGEAFEAYCREVPRFVPRHLPWPLPQAPYDANRMLRKHREWQAWLGLYAVTLYLLLRGG
ncbi:MAG: isoprenylcysteine carboxylmethyltransferase family protein [Deltaproteobacteria bacterium]|nr:isoprenylcysteine carboxylmethyltransferase family protein [Deltaproteobacteria bacterium]